MKPRLLPLVFFFIALASTAVRGEEGPPALSPEHWAFALLTSPHPPKSTPGTHPIDAFIRAKLSAVNLAPNPPADRRTLIRRLTFDLHGLPPTPQQIEDFLNDARPDNQAVASLIERLLASPRYGERWARHWLDVVRFSESQGFERDKFRPNSWRYRDYVIASLNEDKPYDQFAREQIAGDIAEPIASDGIVATGFLTAGPWDEVGNGQKSQVMKSRVREEELEDIISAVGQTFLGVTINCARCHDHKFDPVSAKDYYAIKAVFEGVRHGERSILLPTEFAKRKPRIDRLKKALRELEKQIKQKSTPEQSAEKVRLETELNRLEPKTYAANSSQPGPTHFLERGDIKLKKEIAIPGGLSVLPGGKHFGLAGDAPEGQRRLAFAKWMTSPGNPLFARAIVNRVWHYHFGAGLVTTPNDLGASGSAPSHPALLDWLAGELIRQGWRLKELHRLILTSQTWRQSSRADSAAFAADAENRLLWRFAPKRLEAEAVRDSMLAISGELNFRAGGPSDRPYELIVDNTHFYTFKDGALPEFNRRTIYRAQIASLRDSLLDALDCPGIGLKAPVRGVTTTPIQALSLMNNSFVDRQSRKLAERLAKERPGDFSGQLKFAFEAVLGRTPTGDEVQRAGQLRENHSLSQVCWALFNSTEFIFVK